MPDLKGAMPVWRFYYKNWRGENHVYKVQVQSVRYGEVGYPAPKKDWLLDATVVDRDSKYRPGERTFVLNNIRHVEVVS
jgi:hypothetical protein